MDAELRPHAAAPQDSAANRATSDPAPSATGIVLRDLHKRFGQQNVLNGVNLTIAGGQTVAVLGRSGTGKSVLLKLIIGLHRPDRGSIEVDGDDVAGLSPEHLNAMRTKMGFLFQDAALYDSLTLAANVAFPLRRHRKLPAAEERDRVQELLTAVGLQDDAQKLPSEVSGGMKKRAGLARALALEPTILLFDEPTAGLDPITAAEIEELMCNVKAERKATSVVVTHDLRGAKAVADRLALLQDGTVLIEGTFDELQRSQQPFVAQFFREGA